VSLTPQPFAMGRGEFVALLAMMLAAVAFSIDAMLPALPMIGAELSPDRPTDAPLIVSTFLFGMGVGTFFTGPLSDAYGRKRVILVFSWVFIAGAAIAWVSPSLEMVLVGRVLQGLGAAGPRIVANAIVRDRFAGRQMAKILSVIMMIFVMIPAVAPLMGSIIIDITGWRGIFGAFIAFAMTYSIWMMLRLPETLAPENRRPLRLRLMGYAVAEVIRHPVSRLSILAIMFVSAMLFLTIMLVQPLFDTVYGRADEFPFWFFFIAIAAGSASLLNALLVVRFGMWRLVTTALAVQIVLSSTFLLFDLGSGPFGFYFFVFWLTCIFFQTGLSFGNLNALAMEHMGHIAGMASSVIGAISTVGAVAISGPIGTMFNGHYTILITSVLVLASAGFFCMLWMERFTNRSEVL